MHNAYEVIAHIVQLNSMIEAINCVAYTEGPNWRTQVDSTQGIEIAARLRGIEQDRGERVLARLTREQVIPENLRSVADQLPGKLFGVTSKVDLVGGGVAHIPMMDFMCSPSSSNLETVTQLLNGLHQGRGWLLESGRSYHYYGCLLLTHAEWTVFLGKCLLMSGYTDDRYIGHQLVDGHCVLRLSSRRSNSGIPLVVAEVS